MKQKFSAKQAFWFTFINYIGVAIGMFSTLFIYPHNKSLLGIFNVIDSVAQMVYPLLVFGASTALLYFQPKLSHFLQRKIYGYGFWSITTWSIFAIVVMGFVYPIFPNYFSYHYFFGLLIAIALAYIDLAKRQAVSLQKVAIPTFIEKIIPKVALPFFFYLIFKDFLSFNQGISGYILSFVFMGFLLQWFLQSIFKPYFGFHYKDLFQHISKKNYHRYTLYACAASLGSFFAFRIDALMIDYFLNTEANGNFRLASNLANAMMIPATGIFALYSPIISEYLETGNWEKLKEKYKEVAKKLFFIGIIIFAGIILCLNDFFYLMPTSNQLLPIVDLSYVLGALVLINMATGFNTEIIAFSKHYNFNLIAIISLAFINILLNYILLTQTSLGLIGVAMASLVSMLLFNSLKMIFIYKKYNMLPFDEKYLQMVIIGIAVLLAIHWLPLTIIFPYDFIWKILCYVLLLFMLNRRLEWINLSDFKFFK